MTSTPFAYRAVETDDEGFLADPSQWDHALGEQIAHENGIPELTNRHWLVIEFMRHRFLTTGAAPSIRALGKESGVPVKELYQLFPRRPGQARRQDRRHPQAPRLHLGRSA
jgi:tRNA 2-thiouridine synthesizing protein E